MLMPSQPIVGVSAALSTALSSMGRAWVAVLSFAAALLAVQTLTVLCLSDDLLAKRAFHTSDGSWITVSLLAQTWFGVGLGKLSLDAIRETSVRVADLFAPPGMVFRFLLVGLVAGVAALLVGCGPLLLVLPVADFLRSHGSQAMLVVGVLLLLLPGVALLGYLSLIWSQFFWLLVDTRARYFDSLSRSKQLTDGSRWRLARVYSVWSLLLLPPTLLSGGTPMFEGVLLLRFGLFL
jgi:hypothetical protein